MRVIRVRIDLERQIVYPPSREGFASAGRRFEQIKITLRDATLDARELARQIVYMGIWNLLTGDPSNELCERVEDDC